MVLKTIYNFSFIKLDKRLRFVLVGIWNTIFGFLAFVLFYKIFVEFISWERLQYIGAMLLGQSISVLNAFFMHKKYTFRSNSKGMSSFKEFLRFNSIYLVILVLNLIILPILIEVFLFNPILAGGFSILLTTLFSYFAHSKYTFKNKHEI